jgi:AcrR family transcriptional regulator
MNPQVRAKPDDTRARIMEAAEVLFRRLGYAKTAVADIATRRDDHRFPAKFHPSAATQIACY